MNTAADFIALLDRYGLPAELFEIEEEDDCDGMPNIYVTTKHGVCITNHDDGMVYLMVNDAEIDDFSHVDVDFDQFFAPIIKEYKIQCENAALRKENAALREENAALRLLPGGPEYFAAKEHYENMAKK